jgi:hypothetical protein
MRPKEVTATTIFPAKPGRADPKPEGQATYQMANLRAAAQRAAIRRVHFTKRRNEARMRKILTTLTTTRRFMFCSIR